MIKPPVSKPTPRRACVLLALVAAQAAVPGAAQAVVVDVSATWDLRAVFDTRLLDSPVTIANGDHVVFTVDFAGPQTLSFDGGSPIHFWTALFAGDNLSSFTIDDITLELLGFSGTGGAAARYTKPTESGGLAHLGPQWADWLSAGQSVTFSGFTTTFDVRSIAQSPHRYERSYLSQYGGTVSPVPEPLTSSLFGAGLAGLLGWGRSRRREESAGRHG